MPHLGTYGRQTRGHFDHERFRHPRPESSEVGPACRSFPDARNAGVKSGAISPTEHDGSGCDDRSVSDFASWKQRRTSTDPGIGADPNRSRKVRHRGRVMIGREELYSRPNVAAIADLDRRLVLKDTAGVYEAPASDVEPLRISHDLATVEASTSADPSACETIAPASDGNEEPIGQNIDRIDEEQAEHVERLRRRTRRRQSGQAFSLVASSRPRKKPLFDPHSVRPRSLRTPCVMPHCIRRGESVIHGGATQEPLALRSRSACRLEGGRD